MSGILWHAKDGEVRLAGSERAYMQMLCNDVAYSVLANNAGFFRGDAHPIAGVLQADHYQQPQLRKSTWEGRGRSPFETRLFIDDAAANSVRSVMTNARFTFDGETHNAANLSLNTVVATGSPTLSLLARLHGYCESHAWVSEDNREWLASVIDSGRASNIFRADQGWEDVAEFLRQGDLFPGEVFTSYTVCDGFPGPEACDWMSAAWPQEMVEADDYRYDDLTDEQKEAVSKRSEEWYDLTKDEQWELARAGVQAKHWLQLTPETLTTPPFATEKSYWDVVASPEWIR